MSFNITPESATPAGVVTAGTTQTAAGVIVTTRKSRGTSSAPSSYAALLTNTGEIFVFAPNGTLLYKITVSPAPTEFDLADDGWVITWDGTTNKVFDNTGAVQTTRTGAGAGANVTIGTTYAWIGAIAYNRTNIGGTAVVTLSSSGLLGASFKQLGGDNMKLVANRVGDQVLFTGNINTVGGNFFQAYLGTVGGSITQFQFEVPFMGGGTGTSNAVLMRATLDLFISLYLWSGTTSADVATFANSGLTTSAGLFAIITGTVGALQAADIDDAGTTLVTLDAATQKSLKVYTVSATLVLTLQRTITLPNAAKHMRILDNATYVLVVEGTTVEVYSVTAGTLLYTYSASQTGVPTFFIRQVQ